MMMKYKELEKILIFFDIKNGEELTKLFCKSDVILLADVMEEFVKVSTEEYDLNTLFV